MLILFAGALSACDPAVHVAYSKDFFSPVDRHCIETALKAVVADVTKSTYVDDGSANRGFKKGVAVSQFGYSDPTYRGYFSLDLGTAAPGVTHYWHGWSKLGTDIPVDEQRRIVPLLVRANLSVGKRCGLSFSRDRPVIGSG